MNNQSLKRLKPDMESPPRSVQRTKRNILFETVANILDDATHARLDQEVFAEVKGQKPGSTTFLLLLIASNSDDCIDAKYMDIRAAKAFLKMHPDLEPELWKAWEAKSFKNIRNLKILRPPQPTMTVTAEDAITRVQEQATEGSWERSYIGEAQKALWMHIERHYNPKNINVYAHYAAIVQSSGMGKSRAVDELGKEHFSLPINLREPESTGYPPADHVVRNFLAMKGTQAESSYRSYSFLDALFQHTEATLSLFDPNMDISQVAEEFRRQMTTGQTMKEHNRFRRTFYETVIRIAKEKFTKAQMATESAGEERAPVHTSPLRTTDAAKNVLAPLNTLNKLLTALRARERASQTSPLLRATMLRSSTKSGAGQVGGEPEDKVPLVILAFDEAHTLTDREGQREGVWSNFSELRHVLRGLHYLPLFSLFLSTTGKISQFTSAKDEDISKRVINGTLTLIQPFTDLGFDTLATPVSLDGSWDLEKVTTDSHMAHLGRPLFGSRYDAGDDNVRNEIILFAIGKLLNADHTVSSLSEDQALACLSQRLPIEFNSTTYLAQTKERKQVEGHMRVCLKIDSAFHSMTTVSASEPLLSEAAYVMMNKPFFDAPKMFKAVLEGFAVHKGDRGEFVGLLLLILARDKAVGDSGHAGRPMNNRRFFDTARFVSGHLFPHPAALTQNNFISSKSARALKELHRDFPDANMHFNHFVKLHDYKSIDKQCLLLMMSRAAGILCANNHHAIDAINVFLRSGTKLSVDNLGLILYQIKNDSKYNQNPKLEAFAAMNPYNLAILKTGDAPVPLIRIFFALASKTPSLVVTRHEPSFSYNAIVYDIWCAGISSEVLNINPLETDTWDALVQASYTWQDLYNTEKGLERNLRRSMNPGAAYDDGHWSRWSVRGDDE